MCFHVNKNCLIQVNTEVVGAQIEPLLGSTHMEWGSCLRSGLDLIAPFWRSSGIKLMKEKSELNHQESFLSSHLYLEPQNAQVLSHLSLKWNEIWMWVMVAKVWQQKIVRQKCLRKKAKEWVEHQGFLVGFVGFLITGLKLINSKIYLVLGLDQRLKCPNKEQQQQIMKKHK